MRGNSSLEEVDQGSTCRLEGDRGSQYQGRRTKAEKRVGRRVEKGWEEDGKREEDEEMEEGWKKDSS